MFLIRILLPFVFLFFIACGESDRHGGNNQTGLSQGDSLFAKYGCLSCHSIAGHEMYGPPLNGLYSKEIKVIRQGQESSLRADRKYLKRSIMDPEFEKVKGYEERTMPPAEIPKKDLKILLDYLMDLEGAGPSPK